jgi:hypothetical protein
MIRNTDKRHAGDVPVAADGPAAGAFGSCREPGFPAFNAAQSGDCDGRRGTSAISNKLNTFAFVNL